MIIMVKKKFLGIFLCSIMAVSICVLGTTSFVKSKNNNQVTVRLPILMYHHLVDKNGAENDYVLSKDTFEKDLIYIKENGYQTVSIEDLISFKRGQYQMPEKPIMITFDDGQESFYAYAYPLLEKYKFDAVFSVVGEYVDRYTALDEHNLTYSCVTWDEVKVLSQSPYVEIGNHTYDMHSLDGPRKGCKMIKGESQSEYECLLTEDVSKMQDLVKRNTGSVAKVFTYPFGLASDQSVIIIKKMGFEAVLTCSEKVNIINNKDQDWIYNLGRFNRPSKYSTESFFKIVESK